MRNLQKIGGICAVLEAFIYISVFALYACVLATPSTLSTAQKLAFLGEKQNVFFLVNVIGYIVFGVLLAVIVLALHERMKYAANTLSQIASVFGILWVGLVITSGMLANIGLGAILRSSIVEPEQTRSLWLAITTMTEALGGGNELVGGIWVLLISCAGIASKILPRTLHYVGIVVGAVGIATCYPAKVLTEIFGVSQIVWFGYLGIALLRQR